MRYPICSIRDSKTGFLAPTIDINLDAAIRAFGHAISRSPDILGSCPGDFDLYELGEFDTDSGRIEPLCPVVHLISGPDAFRKVVGKDEK